MGLETMAMISLGATAASGAVGAVGAGMTGAANKQAADYRAAVARNNAIIAENNARNAQLTSQANAQRIGFRGAEQYGQIAAIQGASGLDMGSGSFTAVRDSAEVINRLDQLSEVWKGDSRATDYRNQSAAFTAGAGLADAEGRNAETAGNMGIANSLIGSAGNFGSKWMNFRFGGTI